MYQVARALAQKALKQLVQLTEQLVSAVPTHTESIGVKLFFNLELYIILM